MKRILLAVMMLSVPAVVFGAADLEALLAKVRLQHKWQVTCEADTCKYESRYKPPVPFQWRNEAVMSVTAASHNRGSDLDKVIKGEVASIRKSATVIEYLDEDGRTPNQNIATWKENLGGREVGFIKYRGRHEKFPMPNTYTAIHGIVLGSDRDFYVHLLSLYAGHYDQVIQDHLSILKTLAASTKE